LNSEKGDKLMLKNKINRESESKRSENKDV